MSNIFYNFNVCKRVPADLAWIANVKASCFIASEVYHENSCSPVDRIKRLTVGKRGLGERDLNVLIQEEFPLSKNLKK